uniref:Uncharacterized protein n=1 Tax=Petromyzon marinus TaxID=7757 RepID=S4RC25_PETMA
VTFFTLLSGVCVMLNLAGSILSCQNAQLVNSLTHCQLVKPGDDGVCVCCERQQTGGCTNLGSSLKKYILIHDTRTKSWHTLSVCCLRPLGSILGSHRDLQLLQFVSSRMLKYFVPQRSSHVQHDCLNTHNSLVHQTVDFEEFVPPIPPPPYYPPEYTYTPVMDANRTSRLHLIHCPYDICVPRVGCEAVYPGELPPPYEAVVAQTRTTQVGVVERAARVEGGGGPCRDASVSVEVHARGRHGGGGGAGGGCAVAGGVAPSRPAVPRPSSPDGSPPSGGGGGGADARKGAAAPAQRSKRATARGERGRAKRRRRSGGGARPTSRNAESQPDSGERFLFLRQCPVLTPAQLSGEGNPDLWKYYLNQMPPSFRTSPPPEAPRERPRSLVDLQTYEDTKILVSRFLESSSGDLPPDVRHVVNDIKSVIASDERHMEEAILSASVLDQV